MRKSATLFLALATAASALSPAQSATARTGPAPPVSGVLLISDQEDGVSDPLYFDDYYTDAIDDIFGHPYYYNILYHTREVRAEDLAGHGAVVWYTGISGGTSSADGPAGHITLTEDEEDAVIQYLETTPSGECRGVWLSGMYIAWNCVAEVLTEGQLYSELFSSYIGLSYPTSNFRNPIHVDSSWIGGSGSSSPPLNGAVYSIWWAVGDYNYPDMLDTSGSALSALTWQDSGGTAHHSSIIANQGTSPYGGTWYIVLSALPLESIGTESSGEERSYIMSDVLSWFQVTVGVTESSWGQIKASFND
jgi:hypothetical protein